MDKQFFLYFEESDWALKGSLKKNIELFMPLKQNLA